MLFIFQGMQGVQGPEGTPGIPGQRGIPGKEVIRTFKEITIKLTCEYDKAVTAYKKLFFRVLLVQWV